MPMLPKLPRIAAGALACLVLAACGEASTEPQTSQNIEVTNVFATNGASARFGRASFAEAAVQITKIRLTVTSSPSGTRIFQQVFDVDPTASKWTLQFTAPKGETVKITAELISVTAGQQKVEYSGQAGPLTIQECTADCAPIPIKTWPGPLENLGASSVTISPDNATVVEGATTTLTATVAPAGSFTVSWRSLDPTLATVSNDGVVSGVLNGNARIVAAVGTVADTTTVAVTAANTCVETPYALGATANATWTAGDCLAGSGSGRHFDQYALTLTQSAAFTVSVTGPAGRRINLRQAGTQNYVQLMASDAFMPPASNPLTVGYVLPAGSYVMEIATPDAATLGAYTVASSTGLPGGCSTIVYVWPSVTVNGTIGNNDCTSPGGAGREDRYILLPDAGTRLSLGLTPSGFAPVLVYRDDRQAELSPTLAMDVQSTLDAPAKVDYTTTFAGFTEIIVSHATAAMGTYSLSIGTASTTNTCSTIPMTVTGGTRMAAWDSTDCVVDGRLVDRYSFTTTQQMGLSTTLSSSAVGAKAAGVFSGTTEILDWGVGAGTTTDLKATWFLPAGSYEFAYSAPSSAAGQTYSAVTSQTSDITCTNNGATGNVTFTTQTLGGNDCRFDSTTFDLHKYEDRVMIFLQPGKTVDAKMTGGTFAGRVVVRDPASAPGQVFGFVDTPAGTQATTSYTNNTGLAQYVQVIYTSSANEATGSYSGAIVIR
jgi:hypothetical protein